jgi:hypothetical protein
MADIWIYSWQHTKLITWETNLDRKKFSKRLKGQDQHMFGRRRYNDGVCRAKGGASRE